MAGTPQNPANTGQSRKPTTGVRYVRSVAVAGQTSTPGGDTAPAGAPAGNGMSKRPPAVSAARPLPSRVGPGGKRKRLGELLLEANVIDEDQLDRKSTRLNSSHE